DLRGELDRARMRVRPVGVEGQLTHLLERRLADLLAVAVADVDREEPCERVEVALAVRVPQVPALAPDDDRHPPAPAAPPHAREVHPQVGARELLQVGRRAHDSSGIGTTATGIGDRCMRRSTTEPSRAALSGLRPSVPTTIVDASTSAATARSTSAALPCSM